MKINKSSTCWAILFTFARPYDALLQLPFLSGRTSSLGLPLHVEWGKVVHWCWLLCPLVTAFHPPRASHPIIFWKSSTTWGVAIVFDCRASDLHPSSLLEKRNDSESVGGWLGFSPLLKESWDLLHTKEELRQNWVLFLCSFVKDLPLWVGRPDPFAFIQGPTNGLFIDSG